MTSRTEPKLEFVPNKTSINKEARAYSSFRDPKTANPRGLHYERYGIAETGGRWARVDEKRTREEVYYGLVVGESENK